MVTHMAKRTASAKKQARAGVRRAARNRGVKSEVKTLVTKARRSFSESPVASSDRAALALDAVRALDRAAAKGILHTNNAARRKARIMRQLVKIGAAEEPGESGQGQEEGDRGAGPGCRTRRSGQERAPLTPHNLVRSTSSPKLGVDLAGLHLPLVVADRAQRCLQPVGIDLPGRVIGLLHHEWSAQVISACMNWSVSPRS